MDELQMAAQAYSDAQQRYEIVKAYVAAIPPDVELDVSIQWNFGGSMHGFSETRRLVEQAHDGPKAREMLNNAVDDAEAIMSRTREELIALAEALSQ